MTLIGCTAWDEPIFPNLIGYIEKDEIRPLVTKTFALKDIATAQQEFLKKTHFGNFVLVPGSQLIHATKFCCFRHYGSWRLANWPTFNLESAMSKKPEKATITTATIEEQTAAFLKAGGAIEYVGKGKSGQIAPAGSKQISLKAR